MGLVLVICNIYIINMTWIVETLDKRVDRELAKLPRDLYARFLQVGELLEEYGPRTVGMPHVRFLTDGLWEMRLSGKHGIARAICVTATKRRLIVVYVFQKKTQRTPSSILKNAKKRAKEVE